jgi:type III secretion protein J
MNPGNKFLNVCVAIFLVGCGKINLYSDLSEQQANEVTAVLIAAQIDADKQASENKSWMVLIDKAELPRAMDVLETSGFPKSRAPTMAEIFKKDGFISSPLEERARFIAATQQELQQTVEKMNGVLAARVHLALPERDPLSDKFVPPSVSVFVKYAQEVKFDAAGIENVKSIVKDAIEGLASEKITVVVTPAAGPWRKSIRPHVDTLAEYSYQRPFISLTAWLMIAGLLFLLLLSAGIFFTRAQWLPVAKKFLPWIKNSRKSEI